MTISSITSQSSDWTTQLLDALQGKKSNQDDDLASKLMSDLDGDGTSTLSLEESGLSESLFATADVDGDGQITAQELADALAQERSEMMAGSTTQGAGLLGTLLSQAGVSTSPQGMGQMPEPPDDDKMADDIVSALDEDGDSALSMEESGLTEEVFDSIDTDGDGVISSQELADALQADREEKMAAGGAGGSGGADSTASNASTDKVLQSLLSSTSQINPNLLRAAIEAYGNNLVDTSLGEYDPAQGLSAAFSQDPTSFMDFLAAGGMDYTV